MVSASQTLGLTPHSPEIRQSVDKAVRFLESAGGKDDRTGGKALVALALLKSGAKKNHPRIREALSAINQSVRSGYDPSKVYEPAIIAIFLTELDPKAHASQIQNLLSYMLARQKPHGGWGYPAGHHYARTGDTSMSQYVILGAWEAAYAGIEMPLEPIDSALVWLCRTQDPSGAFGYQGTVAPAGKSLVKQSGISPSLSAAGLGSIYACADLLHLQNPNDPLPVAPPSALQAVGGSRRRVSREMLQKSWKSTSQQVHASEQLGIQWMEKNYTLQSGEWTNYYLYALERYHSFRELAEKREEESPKWYNDGAKLLFKTQLPNGAWASGHELAGEPSNTSFAILFLVRSMQTTIGRIRNFGAGTMIGGRGLPKDTDTVVVRGGDVMSMPEVQAVEKLLAVVGEESDPEHFKTIEALSRMPSGDAMPMINKHAEKFRKLVGTASPEARLAAVRALARRRDMEDVPVLIYALTDPDGNVVLAARDGLRRVSRKFLGFGLPDQFTDQELQIAITKWKQWYLTIRPDAELMD